MSEQLKHSLKKTVSRSAQFVVKGKANQNVQKIKKHDEKLAQ